MLLLKKQNGIIVFLILSFHGMIRMDKWDKQVWIKHRELEIACWEEHIAHNKLSDEDLELYRKSIEETKLKLKGGR